MPESLAYLAVSTPNIESWPEFGTSVLGAMLAPREDTDTLDLRFDDAAWRLRLMPGGVDDVAYIGWSVHSIADLDEHTRRLEALGVEVADSTQEERTDRQVKQMRWCTDPAGYRHELVVGQYSFPGTFTPGRPMSGFVTGPQGLGHVVLAVPNLVEADAFFTDGLGFELSDWLVRPETGFEGRFYHCNGRHHSLALGESPGMRGLNHLMVQVRDLDDVGIALDLCLDGGVPVTRELGRHTNDQMFSFYMQTPSSFNIEYGFGGVEVDPSWTVQTYLLPSIWGHRVPEGSELSRGILVQTPTAI
jgi:extradiol dioxygenase